MSMEQLMALVPLEAALSHKEKGRKSRWERKKAAEGSRWGSETDKPFLPPPFVDLPIGMTPLQVDRFLREQRLEELSRKLQQSRLELGDADIRPASPAPVYDKNGGRVNTREARAKAAMLAEQQSLLEFMLGSLKGFVAPPDFRPAKKIRRIEFPHEKYPDYNFMGIIIGPRGCNHKRLEAESGCTISVRGRGTQKEGKRDHQTDEEASMPMHVHIMGDTDEAVERAVALVEPLLDPLHPAHEEFKRRGLEQLALVNGVNYGELDQRRCALCQALGHLAHECPDNRDLQPFKRPEVRCAICGDLGHVTMDCKMRRGDGAAAAAGTAAAAAARGRPPPPPPMGMRPPMRSGADSYRIDMVSRSSSSSSSSSSNSSSSSSGSGSSCSCGSSGSRSSSRSSSSRNSSSSNNSSSSSSSSELPSIYANPNM
ncbi:zinc knuckle domain-containing protein, putative [Eimeria tenella]|uniref:Branchpoint-bridging protein n=1 Tax=Eimeria tenella TaxID=5802 RepID=U6KNP4_EIMTE|nr:zinc knuckle domain-containing protein, putative [Eimeria tenella]CDJ39742.1 zinc knuckle domain-containing protein, putative [Eimeria tenella]|eukprot:XP_013230495.1 zinc knuckle domain-containing protein, putative [Eimeria tenella]